MGLRDSIRYPNGAHAWPRIVGRISICAQWNESQLTIDSYVFANFQIQLNPSAENVSSSKTIPTFLTLYIFGFLYELVLVYDALRLKNTIQVIGICICNVGLLIYGAVQMEQIKEAVGVLMVNDAINMDIWAESKPFLIAIPCIVGLGSAMMAFVAWKLYDEFAWTIYKHISADLRMKRRYLTYQVCRFLVDMAGICAKLTRHRSTSLS